VAYCDSQLKHRIAFSVIVSISQGTSKLCDSPATIDSPRLEQRLPTRQILTTILALAIATGVALAVLGLLADRPHTHLSLRLQWLAPAIVALIALELFHAELWRRLLLALGGALDTPHALAIWAVSAVARYVPSSMLMPVVRVRMGRRQGVPGELGVVSVVYEALLVNCGAACVASYFVVALPALRHDPWRWAIVALPLAAISALHPRVVGFVTRRLLASMGRPISTSHVSLGQLLGFAAGYAASFMLAGCGMVAVVLMVYPLTLEGVPTVIGAAAIGFVVSVFAFVLPGGLGAREAALALALSPVVPTFVASTAAVASRVVQLGCELTLAALLPWVARRHQARQSQRR